MNRLKLISLLLFLPQVLAQHSALADEELRFGATRISIGKGITLKSPELKAKSKVAAFFVESPNRLVIDVIPPLYAKNLTDKSNLKTGKLFGRIRVGSEAAKTRFVLDFKNPDAALAGYEARVSAAVGSAEISFAAPGAEKVAEESAPEKKPTPITAPLTPVHTSAPTSIPKEATATPKPIATVPPTQTHIPLKTPTAAPTLKASPSPTALSTSAPLATAGPKLKHFSEGTLKQIEFRQEDQDRFLALECDRALNYTSSYSPDENVSVLLEGGKLAGEHLALERFPPESFLGFQAAQAKPEADGVRVQLFLDPGYTAESVWNGSVLQIRAIKK